MKIDNKIRDEKLKNDINIEPAKTVALSSGKIDKYEYQSVEEISPSAPSQTTEQTTFTYYPLGKVFEKQTSKYH